MNSMDRILVTGGMGFIGSHTVDELVKRGYEVKVMDNLEHQVHGGVAPSYKNKDAKYLHGDIRHRKSWLAALQDVDSVIHLAGSVGIGQSFWEAKKYVDTNVSGTALMYELLTKDVKLRKRINKIVVASSKSLYGEGSYVCEEHGLQAPDVRPIKQLQRKEWEVKCPVCGQDLVPTGVMESKYPQNLNPYSLSKYATERPAMDYSYSLGIPTVAFRYFNVYGERQSLSNPYTGVMAIFLSRIKNKNSPFLFEDGKQLRDYIYVKDVARLNANALNHGSGVYNLGTGNGTSLLEVVHKLNQALGTDIRPTVSNEFRPGDNRHDFADISLLIRDFGKNDFTPLEKGIKILAQWSEGIESVDRFEKEEAERKKFLSAIN